MTPGRRGGRRIRLVIGCSVGLLLAGVGGRPASATVTSVSGSAYGYVANVSLFNSPVNTRPCTNPPTNTVGCGPAPAVTLPPAGSAGPVTATAAMANAGVGPATLFTAGQVSVSTQGTTGANGAVTSSTGIANLNTSTQESFTATGLSSTCTASASRASRSTTVTGGTLETDSGEDLNGDGDFVDVGEHPPVSVAVAGSSAPNTTILGHIHVNGAQDSFRYVLNEQVTNPDGSLVVNAAHEYLLGPTAIGDLILGHAVCQLTATAAGNGYYLVASDGGIFAFGDATFRGSTGATTLTKPIVGIAVSV